MPERLDVLIGRPAEANSLARRPANFAGSPEDSVAAFSEVLSGVIQRRSDFLICRPAVVSLLYDATRPDEGRTVYADGVIYHGAAGEIETHGDARITIEQAQ